VFNRPEVVRPEVRARVMECAQQIGYEGPDPAARMLRAGKANAVGVVTDTELSYFFNDPYLRLFMEGVAEVCDTHSAGLSLVSSLSDEAAAWTVQTAMVDGFIVDCMEHGHRLIDLALKRKLPFVAADLDAGPGINCVKVDDVEGARLAARHLLDLGHRRLAILSMPFRDDDRVGFVDAARCRDVLYVVTGARMTGYRKAFAEAGLDPELVPVYETQHDAPSIRAGLETLMALDPRPTALIGMADVIALQALDLLRERGIAVPQDVSLVGFDGIADSERSQPPLTTIVQPIREKGRRAAEMVFDGSTGRQVTLPLTLAVRGSTAPPRQGG
ncbi:MAG: substrate-binding domain-containing protein, partial [Alphaproteobacteria bacterium]